MFGGSGQSLWTRFLKIKPQFTEMDMCCLFSTTTRYIQESCYDSCLSPSPLFSSTSWFSNGCRQKSYLACIMSAIFSGSAIPVGLLQEHIIIITQNSPAAVQPAGMNALLLILQSINSVTQSICACSLTNPENKKKTRHILILLYINNE